jgi:hypothetical protein
LPVEYDYEWALSGFVALQDTQAAPERLRMPLSFTAKSAGTLNLQDFSGTQNGTFRGKLIIP